MPSVAENSCYRLEARGSRQKRQPPASPARHFQEPARADLQPPAGF